MQRIARLDRRNRARVACRACPRAGVAVEADQVGRAVRARRHHRHPRAHRRREARARAGPAGDHREQAGRRRRRRRRVHGQVGAGWLHDHGRHDQHARDQRVAVQEPPLRSGEGFRRDHADRARAEHAGRQSGGAGEEREGADRAAQGESEQVLVRVERQRHVAASVRRALQVDVRHRHAAHSRTRAVRRRCRTWWADR